MQHDFAAWLRKNWRSILDVSEVPALLAAHLQQDRSLETNYSHRLKKFITGSATASAASQDGAVAAAALHDSAVFAAHAVAPGTHMLIDCGHQQLLVFDDRGWHHT